MNKERRQRLGDALVSLDEAIDIINEVRDDEQDAYDNMPDSLQMSSRGDAMMDAIDTLDGYIVEIENIEKTIEEFIG